MKVRLALVEHMPDIIRESVKPMERIDGSKIFQVDGLGGNGGGLTQSLASTPDGDAKAATVDDGADTDDEDPA